VTHADDRNRLAIGRASVLVGTKAISGYR